MGPAVAVLLCLRALGDPNQGCGTGALWEQGSTQEFQTALGTAGGLLRVEEPKNAASWVGRHGAQVVTAASTGAYGRSQSSENRVVSVSSRMR